MSNLITTCLRTGFLQGLFPKNFSYIFLEGIFRGVKVTFTPFAEFHRFWQFQIGSLNNYLINLSIMNNHATCNSWWVKTGKTSHDSNVQKQMNCESSLFITRIYLKLYFPFLRSSHQRCSVKKGVLRNFTKFTGVFGEFCEISKNTFSHRPPLMAASVSWHFERLLLVIQPADIF